MSGIQIDVQARTSQAEKNLANINQSLKNIDSTTTKTADSLSNMFKVIGLFATAAAGLKYVKRLSSEFQNLENKIAVVTGRTRELVIVQRQLLDLSVKTRSSYQSTVDTYTAFGRALRETGASSARVLKVTQTVQQSIALSGASAIAANNAIIQLGQGLSSGTLRGEELRSVMEQLPRLAYAMADEMGVTVGQFRRMANEGKITTDIIFKALERQASKINEEFKRVNPTLEQTSEILSTSLKVYVNEFTKGLGLADASAASMLRLGTRIKEASRNAFELGNQVAKSYGKIRTNAVLLFGPILSSIKTISKQFAEMFPTFSLTRTLKRDFLKAVRDFDQMTGGWIESWKRFRFATIFKWESDVEKAFRRLKRLGPQNWIGGGFNVETMKRLFSQKTLRQYALAFKDLATAIKGNTNTIGSTLDRFSNKLRASLQGIQRYFGFRLDTIFAIRRGSGEAFFDTMAQLTRAVSNASMKIWELGKIMRSYLYPAFDVFVEAFKDAFPNLFKGLGIAAKGVLELFTGVFKILKQMFKDLNEGMTFKEGFKDVAGQLRNLMEDVSDTIKETFQVIGIVAVFRKAFAGFDKVQKVIIEFIEKAIKEFKKLFGAIEEIVVDNLTKAYNKVKDFCKDVIEQFKYVYDKVIGNSWWTDTIETIVSSANSLQSRTAGGISKFVSFVHDSFKDIFDTDYKFKLKEIKFDRMKIELPIVAPDDIKDKLVNFWLDVKEVLIKITNAFPQLLSVALLSAAGLLVASLFPPGKLKIAIITAILTSLSTNATLIAEKFEAALTGGSFASQLGYIIGNALGYVLASFLRNLPEIANALLGFGASLTRGIVEQLPIIGGILKSFFSVSNFVGIAGPLGIVGTILFGLGGVKGLQAIGVGGKSLKGFSESIGKIFNFINGRGDLKNKKELKGLKPGQSKYGELGLIGSTLFGNENRRIVTLSSLGIVLDSMGVFNSLFANSPLMHMAFKGGLIYLALFGQQGLLNITSLFMKHVAVPLSAGFSSLLAKFKPAGNNLGKMDIFSAFFNDPPTGPPKPWLMKTQMFMMSVYRTISDKMIDIAAGPISKGWNWIQTILFGKDIAKGQKNAMKTITKEYLDPLKGVLKSSLNWMSKLAFNFRRAFDGLFTFTSGVSTSKLSGLFSTINSEVTKTARIVETRAGRGGLVQQLLYGLRGKTGKLVLGGLVVGGLLAAGSAKAEGTSASGTENESPVKRVLYDVKEFVKANPIATVLATLTAGIVVVVGSMLYALIMSLATFDRQAIVIIKNLGLLAQALTIRIGKGLAAMSRNTARMISGSIIGSIAGAVAYSLTDNAEMALTATVLGTMLGGALGKGFLTGTWEVLKFLGSRVLWPVLTGIGAFLIANPIVLAVGAGVGLLGVWLFGESGEFWTDLKAFGAWLRDLALPDFMNPWKEKPYNAPSGLSKRQEKFLQRQDISLDYDLTELDTTRLDSKQKAFLKTKRESLQKLVDEGLDLEFTGQPLDGTKKQIETEIKGLTNFLDKTIADTSFSFETFQKDLAEVGNFKFGNRGIDRLTKGSEQFARNRLLYFNRLLLQGDEILNRFTDRENSIRERMKLLSKAEAEGQYIAGFRPGSESSKRVSGMFTEWENLEYENEKIKVVFGERLEAFLAAEKAIGDIKGRYKRELLVVMASDRPSSNYFSRQQLEIKYQKEMSAAVNERFKAEQRVNNELQRAKLFDLQTKAIKRFQDARGKIKDNFASAGIDFDNSGIFAYNNKSFERVRQISNEVEFLGKQLIQTKNIAEHNAIVINIRYAEVEANMIARRAQLIDNIQNVYQAAEMSQNLNLNTPLEELLKWPEEEVNNYLRQLIRFQDAEDRFKNRYVKMAPVGVDFEKRLKPLLSLGFEETNFWDQMETRRRFGEESQILGTTLEDTFGKAMDTFQNRIFDSWSGVPRQLGTNIRRSLEDGTARIALAQTRTNLEDFATKGKKSYNPFAYVSETLSAAGASEDDVVRRYGFDRAYEYATKLSPLITENARIREKGAEITEAEKKAYQSNSLAIKRITDNLAIAATSASDLVSTLSTLGTSFDLKTMSLLSEGELNNLKLAGAYLKNAEKAIKDLESSYDIATLKAYTDQFNKAKELAEEPIYRMMTSNPFATLKEAGFSDYDVISNLTDEEIRRLVRLRADVVKYENRLAKTGLSKEEITENIREIKKANKEIEKATNETKIKVFSGGLEAFNNTFKFSLPEEYFASLPGQLRLALAQEAVSLNNAFEELKKKAIDSSGVLDESYFRAFRKRVNNLSFLEIFAKFREEMSDSLYDGFKTGYDRIKEIFEDFPLDMNAYMSLDKGTRETLSSDAIASSKLEQLNLQEKFPEGINGDQLKADISSALLAGESPAAIVARLESMFVGLFQSDLLATQSELLSANTTKLQYVGEQLYNLTSALWALSPGSFNKIPLARGGWVSGPGTSKSDSIPASLSNGEFVVNAASAKANGPLLQAINSYADGGLVKKLEEFSVAAGFSLSNQLEDMYQFITNPSDSGKMMAEFLKTIVTDPKGSLDAGLAGVKSDFKLAMSGATGLGEVFGKYANPRSVLNPSRLIKPNVSNITQTEARKQAKSILASDSYKIVEDIREQYTGKIITESVIKDYQDEILETLMVDIEKLNPDKVTPMLKAASMGSFDPLIRKIYVPEGLDPFADMTIFSHELGHLLSYDDMTPNVMKRTLSLKKLVKDLRENANINNLPSDEAVKELIPYHMETLPFLQKVSSEQLAEEYLASALGAKISLDSSKNFWKTPLYDAQYIYPKAKLGKSLDMTAAYGSYVWSQDPNNRLLLSLGIMPYDPWDPATLKSTKQQIARHKALYGLASGGPVWGSGTGKSDSIPAWLSNGEFVVNAKSAKENYHLLTAMNSGVKLAEGSVKDDSLSGALKALIGGVSVRSGINNSLLNKSILELRKAVQAYQTSVKLGGRDQTKALADFIGEGIIAPDQMNRATEQQLVNLNKNLSELAEVTLNLKTAEDLGSQADVNTAQAAYDKKLIEVTNKIADSLENVAERIDEAGKEFTQSMGEGLSSTLKDILKGDKTLPDAGKALMGEITGNVIDTLVKGLMDPLTGKGGKLTGIMDDLGEAIYGLFGKGIEKTGQANIKDLFTGKAKLKDVLKKPAEELSEVEITAKPVKSPLEGIQGQLGSCMPVCPMTGAPMGTNFPGVAGATPDMTMGGLLPPFGSVASDSPMQTSDAFGGGSLLGSSFAPGEWDRQNEVMKQVPTPGVPPLFGGDSSADVAKNGFLDVTSGLANVATTVLSSGDKTSGIIQMILGFIPQIITMLAASAVDFFATGGKVKGPGTGTSDSIPAMLSNGEFVINAEATKRNVKLLTAINSGRIRKFAEGGLVSTNVLDTPVSIPLTREIDSSNNSQMISINITGDISRQTKSEIYKMLPNIAEGVNVHNKERNFKYQ